MRVSLTADPAEFVKQLAELRRALNQQADMVPFNDEDALAAIVARFALSVGVPFLTTFRHEARKLDLPITPETATVLATAVAYLLANIAQSTIESLTDVSPGSEDYFHRVGFIFHQAMQTTVETHRRAPRPPARLHVVGAEQDNDNDDPIERELP